MKRLLAALAVLLLPALAFAQSAVRQSGSVNPNDLAKWDQTGIIKSVGGLQGDNTGKGANPFSVTDNSGLAFCANSTTTANGGPYNAFCFGHDAAGNGVLSLGSSGGLGNTNLIFTINGISYPFSGTPGGSSGGATGDGTTDNCTALNNVINAAGAGNPVTITLGQGIYISSCALVSTGRSITVRGAGKASTTLKFTGGTDGLSFTTSVGYEVSVQDLSIQTTAASVGSGLSVNYTTNSYFNRETKKTNINNVSFRGATMAAQAWSQCVLLTNVNYVNIDNMDCVGTNGPSGTNGNAQADNTNTPYGVLIANNNTIHPTDYKFTNSTFMSVGTAIYAENVNLEGLQLLTNSMVNVGTGVHWHTGSGNQGRPQITAMGNNTNTYGSAFDIMGISEGNISGNLIYHNPGSTTAASLITIAGVGGLSIVYNQIESFVQDGVAPTTGITIQQAAGYPVPASYGVTIRGNILGAQASAGTFANGIIFAPGAAASTLGGNYCGPNVTTCTQDTSGTAIGQQLAPGRRYIAVKLSAAQSIPNNAVTSVAWDTIGNSTVGWGATPSANVTVAANSPFLFVRCTGQAEFANNATGFRIGQIVKNGTAVAGATPILSTAASTGTLATDVNLVSGIIPVVGGDALSLQVSQNSGSALSLDPQLTWMECEAVE